MAMITIIMIIIMMMIMVRMVYRVRVKYPLLQADISPTF